MKTNLIIALLFVSSTVISQNSEEKFKISKNQWILGGTIGFNYQNSENPSSVNQKLKSNSFNVRPEIGYAIGDNLVIGITSGYGYGNSKGEDPNFENKRNTYALASYIRKYFSVNKKLAFNLQGEISYSQSKQTIQQTNDLTNYSGKGFFIGIRPGITYGLSDKILLQTNFGSLGYSNSKSTNNSQETSKSNSFGLNLSTSDVYFGVLFVL